MPSGSRSRGTAGGLSSSPRASLIAPMSERQQLALVMQMTTQTNPPAAPTNAEEDRKRTRQPRNVRGETPLHVAAIRGDHEQVQKLLDQGQDPDAPDFAGWTPLHEACSYGWQDVVEVLVKGGANVNAKGLDDDTPLHDAATFGNLKMVQILVNHGGDPFARNAKGKVPADYAAPSIQEFLLSLKENSTKATHVGKARDDSSKKGGNASSSSTDTSKRNSMDGLAQDSEQKEAQSSQDKSSSDNKEDSHNQLSSGVVSSSSQDDTGSKRLYYDDSADAESTEDEITKRKKKKEHQEDHKEPMAKPAPVARTATGRILTGTKQPGPASKTGAIPLGKGALGSSGSKNSNTSSKSNLQSGQKGSGSGKSNSHSSHQGKSSGKGSSGSLSKSDRKSPVPSPKQSKDDDNEDTKSQETAAPKVPPLKIVIPGGAGGAGNRNEQEEGGSGQRGSGKGRGNASTLPYVIPCTTTDPGHGSDSSDGNSDDKRSGDGKSGQRVLRSHRTTDGDKDKDKERSSPHSSSQQVGVGNKSPPPSSQGQDNDHQTSTVSSSTGGRAGNNEVLHPRKRKIKARESHREQSKSTENTQDSSYNISHSNPYQMYIHIRRQIDRRQKGLFPVKPKPPKDFNKYLMNRCTYTLQSNVNAEPQVELPVNLPMQMKEEFLSQEKERHRLRIQHLVEKEKLVLAVEQEILRVHGRAERAVNQVTSSLPFSVCTILRDEEVYNVLAPEQEEKRNAQRSRCNGRQIKSWLQEVDDKWEKIKENMLRRQHTEAQALHAVQIMNWEWKLKEVGLCDYKTTPKIETAHVPIIHVSNFDLPVESDRR